MTKEKLKEMIDRLTELYNDVHPSYCNGQRHEDVMSELDKFGYVHEDEMK